MSEEATQMHVEPCLPSGAGGGVSHLDNIAAFIRRYVVLQDDPEAGDFLALWVMHTWGFEASITTPYLRVQSAERESGKTRLLEVLSVLVRRPWFTTNPSAAVLFRKGDAEAPTLLLDELDRFPFTERRDAVAVLNSGYRLGGSVDRCTDKGEIHSFDCFFPKAFAGINEGQLPDTLISRSVPVRLQRRRRSEPVARFFHHRADAAARPLREQAEAWAAAHLAALVHAEPEAPEGLGDRAEEVWWPLLAIADEVGGEWSGRARFAAIVLSGRRETGEESVGVRLLAAIRRVWPEGRGSVARSELLDLLNALEEEPWAAWNDEQGMAVRDLTKRLKPFAIKAEPVTIEGRSGRGFQRQDFEDAWARYLPETVIPVTPVIPPANKSLPEPPDNGNYENYAVTQGGTLDIAPASCNEPSHRSSGWRLRAGTRWICGVCHPRNPDLFPDAVLRTPEGER